MKTHGRPKFDPNRTLEILRHPTDAQQVVADMQNAASNGRKMILVGGLVGEIFFCAVPFSPAIVLVVVLLSICCWNFSHSLFNSIVAETLVSLFNSIIICKIKAEEWRRRQKK